MPLSLRCLGGLWSANEAKLRRQFNSQSVTLLRTKPSKRAQSASSVSDEETENLYPRVTDPLVDAPGTPSERLVLESSDWTAPPIVFTSAVNVWAMVTVVWWMM